jgi:hypothetical protein
MIFLPRGNLILENDSNKKLCHTTFMVYEVKSSCIHIPIEITRIKYMGYKHLHIDKNKPPQKHRQLIFPMGTPNMHNQSIMRSLYKNEILQTS